MSQTMRKVLYKKRKVKKVATPIVTNTTKKTGDVWVEVVFATDYSTGQYNKRGDKGIVANTRLET